MHCSTCALRKLFAIVDVDSPNMEKLQQKRPRVTEKLVPICCPCAQRLMMCTGYSLALSHLQ